MTLTNLENILLYGKVNFWRQNKTQYVSEKFGEKFAKEISFDVNCFDLSHLKNNNLETYDSSLMPLVIILDYDSSCRESLDDIINNINDRHNLSWLKHSNLEQEDISNIEKSRPTIFVLINEKVKNPKDNNVIVLQYDGSKNVHEVLVEGLSQHSQKITDCLDNRIKLAHRLKKTYLTEKLGASSIPEYLGEISSENGQRIYLYANGQEKYHLYTVVDDRIVPLCGHGKNYYEELSMSEPEDEKCKNCKAAYDLIEKGESPLKFYSKEPAMPTNTAYAMGIAAMLGKEFSIEEWEEARGKTKENGENFLPDYRTLRFINRYSR
ncbi:hypothetical protein GF327_07475 [Candidatus Woesearchaeota archaeon]|nr:hypothetical protein [Candidatus Woesearchaeota archaeon]